MQSLPQSWRLFPETTTLAYYDSLAQFIELSEIESGELKEALLEGKDKPQKAIRILPLLFHELRHWVDHIGTLWGVKRLVSAYNAMNARSANNPEEFWRIVEYRRLANRDIFGDYYTVKGLPEPPLGFVRRWMAQLTSGCRFDRDGRLDATRPIMFTQYTWANGKQACRVPFSVSSLLETGSMHFEMEMENTMLIGMSEDERIVEQIQANNRRIQELYDVNLGMYSTAVHLVANRLDISNASLVYPIASALASLCLNLPEHLFDAVRLPSDFARFQAIHSASIRLRDRGYLYLLLVFHGRKELVEKPIRFVENAVRRAGLPPLFEIQGMTEVACQETESSAIDGPFTDMLRNLLRVGRILRVELGIVFTLRAFLEAIPHITLPPVLCSDLKWHGLDTVGAERFEEWYTVCQTLEKQFNEFIAACGL